MAYDFRRKFVLRTTILCAFLSVFLACGEQSATPGSSTQPIDTSAAPSDTTPPGELQLPEPFPTMQHLPRTQFRWTNALLRTWEGVQENNIRPYSTGMVHRPYSETPHDAVSEGVAYGMTLALYSNDQDGFNGILEAGMQYLWNGRYFNWRANDSGRVVGTGAATDADQDIALLLVFADHLVRKNIWRAWDHMEGYDSLARTILNNMWRYRMVLANGTVAPGASWGGELFVNPGYFAPAYYRIFAEFQPELDWMLAVEKSYEILALSPGYSLGLLPDWMSPTGELLQSGPGYNAYGNGHYMYKDAIRVYWRLATDALWFQEPRARSFLQNAMAFLQGAAAADNAAPHPNTPAQLANFYTMQGHLLPADDVFIFAGGERQRPRREHSHLTLGMWACAAAGSGDQVVTEAFSRQLQSFYDGGALWGLREDPMHGEDLAHNEVYFDQFLAWFGAAILNGSFCNILQCIP